VLLLLQEEVAKELGVPIECQRFWLWAKRQNHTYRPNRPLTDQEEAQTVTTATLSTVIRLFLLVNLLLFCSADLGHFVILYHESEFK
jgi:ubiquitin carboxyl-terminal hydrolase 7